MAAIGRFQKADDVFYAKVVEGEIFRLQGDVFGAPSFEKQPTPLKGVRTLTPVSPSKVIAVGLNYADHARETGKALPTTPLDINTASRDALMSLPGIGEVTANAIIEKRPYRRVDDLLRVRGIGPKLLDKLRPGIAVEH